MAKTNQWLPYLLRRERANGNVFWYVNTSWLQKRYTKLHAEPFSPAFVEEYERVMATMPPKPVSKFGDLTGRRFQRLLVLGKAEIRPRARSGMQLIWWSCACDCGKVFDVRGTVLVHGQQRSCGCARELNNRTHGRSGGKNQHPFYPTWQAMLKRCYSETCKDYPLYGGRGITVCDRWRFGSDDDTAFMRFVNDMGERPAGTSIDRIDTNGNYEPGNCRWATAKQQRRNQRDARIKINEAIAATIKADLLDGNTVLAIARRRGLTESIVSGIKSGRCWADVEPARRMNDGKAGRKVAAMEDGE